MTGNIQVDTSAFWVQVHCTRINMKPRTETIQTRGIKTGEHQQNKPKNTF